MKDFSLIVLQPFIINSDCFAMLNKVTFRVTNCQNFEILITTLPMNHPIMTINRYQEERRLQNCDPQSEVFGGETAPDNEIEND